MSKTNKNNKRVPIGRTLKTKDKYLPAKKSKTQKLKNKRWVAVIDKNTNEELAIVRLTDENQKNTTILKNYIKGNKRKTYFKHFVEVEDNEGKPIKIDGVKFIENDKKYDLTQEQVKQIKKTVLKKTKQSQDNQNKINRLKNKNPRD